jgi:hypothetical protein
MKLFVNREPELKLFDESFKALLDERLLRTPFLDFYGAGGIGKTSLLKQVEQRCQDTQLPYIWVDVSQHLSNVEIEIISQVKRYTRLSDNKDFSTATYAMKVLLKQSPAVMLLDAVDTADTGLYH